MASYGTLSPWFTVGLEDLAFTTALAAACIWLASATQPRLSRKQQRALTDELAHVPQAKLADTGRPTVQSAQSRNICDFVKPREPTAIILWGSQGGTAESLARRYASELSRRFSLHTLAMDLDDLDHVHLADVASTALVLFVLSTYGEGDPSDNALHLFDDLRTMRGSGSRLDGLRYCLFGLGNSNYRLYNKAALDADTLLLDMGAQRLGPVGLGDDSNGATEEDFSAWKEALEQQIGDHFKRHPKESPYEPRLKIRAMDKAAQDAFERQQQHSVQAPLPTQVQGGCTALPVSFACDLIREGAEDPLRHCVHLEFDLPGSSIRYDTGDYLQVWPVNPESEIKSLLTILGLTNMADTIIELKATEKEAGSTSQLPSPTSLLRIFRHHLDICGPVSRELARGIAEFVPDIESRHHLEDLVRDRETFRALVTSKRMTLAGLLHYISEGDKDRLRVPVSYILENLKRLQARSYSISSSAQVSPGRISLLVLAAGKDVGRDSNTVFKGLASHFLLDVQRGWSAREQPRTSVVPPPLPSINIPASIMAKIRRSGFRLPSDSSAPIIMVGAGTGVAPFRAFVQERVDSKRKGAIIGKTLLFVGHRASNQDFYYNKVWQEAKDVLGEAFELRTAFSRQGQRTYVQDLLAVQESDFFELLNAQNSGTMYLCGSSAMTRAVKESLKSAWAISCGQRSEVDGRAAADQWLSELQHVRRLQEDSWG